MRRPPDLDETHRGKGRLIARQLYPHLQLDRRKPQDPRPRHRHIARMVDHAFFLLEGGFMLLIHNDQAKIRKGEE